MIPLYPLTPKAAVTSFMDGPLLINPSKKLSVIFYSKSSTVSCFCTIFATINFQVTVCSHKILTSNYSFFETEPIFTLRSQPKTFFRNFSRCKIPPPLLFFSLKEHPHFEVHYKSVSKTIFSNFEIKQAGFCYEMSKKFYMAYNNYL